MPSRWRFALFALLTALAACGGPTRGLSGPAAPPAAAPRGDAERGERPLASHRSRADAVHLLRRFTFGPTPEEVHSATGDLATWFEAQLAMGLSDDIGQRIALAPYTWMLESPVAIRGRVAEDRAFRRRCASLLDSAGGNNASDTGLARRCMKRRRHANWSRALQALALVRHVSAEAQLHEVMVDFWTNHFNVYARKGPTRFYVADYVERAIRPHALGRFGDLLAATAHHPAMLTYLDNATSIAATPANVQRGLGLNENYARELLELHTLGVDGGYVQRDVEEVARALTGFGVDGGAGVFAYREKHHDAGAKHILGEDYPAGGGRADADRLLAVLASHPSTARFVATKLVRRFVSDQPAVTCVGRVTAAFRDTAGDIPSMLRALVACDAFWDPATRGAKFKRPVEFLVSAVRTMGGVPDGTVNLAKALDGLGQPLFMMTAPTGYPDQLRSWLDARAMGARMVVAERLAAGELPGVLLPPSSPPPDESVDALLARVNGRILLGEGSDSSLRSIRDAVTALPSPSGREQLAVSLALISPEFQWR